MHRSTLGSFSSFSNDYESEITELQNNFKWRTKHNKMWAIFTYIYETLLIRKLFI